MIATNVIIAAIDMLRKSDDDDAVVVVNEMENELFDRAEEGDENAQVWVSIENAD